MNLQPPEIPFKDLSEVEQNQIIEILEEFCVGFLLDKQFPTTLEKGVETMLEFLETGVLKLEEDADGKIGLFIFDFREDRYKAILKDSKAKR